MTQEPKGLTCHIYRQGSVELPYLQTEISGVYFCVLNFEICILGVLVTTAVFSWVLKKCFIFKCLIFFTVFFRSSFIHHVIQ